MYLIVNESLSLKFEILSFCLDTIGYIVDRIVIRISNANYVYSNQLINQQKDSDRSH